MQLCKGKGYLRDWTHSKVGQTELLSKCKWGCWRVKLVEYAGREMGFNIASVLHSKFAMPHGNNEHTYDEYTYIHTVHNVAIYMTPQLCLGTPMPRQKKVERSLRGK